MTRLAELRNHWVGIAVKLRRFALEQRLLSITFLDLRASNLLETVFNSAHLEP